MDIRKPKEKQKRLDLKSLLLGTSKETTVPGSRFSNGTQSLVPVVDIRQGVLITEDGRYIKVLEILPTNFYLKSRVEQQNILYYLSSYLKIAPPSLQILVTTQRADIDAYCAQMEQYYNAETSEACKEMIVEDVQLVDYLAATEIVTRKFYLIFAYTGTATELDDIARELSEQAETAHQYLDYCGLEVLRHNRYDEFLLKTLYMAIHKPYTSPVDFAALLSQSGPVCGAPDISAEDLDSEDTEGETTVQDVLAPTECDLTHKGYIVIDGVFHT